jgi:hypothetical protein
VYSDTFCEIEAAGKRTLPSRYGNPKSL